MVEPPRKKAKLGPLHQVTPSNKFPLKDFDSRQVVDGGKNIDMPILESSIMSGIGNEDKRKHYNSVNMKSMIDFTGTWQNRLYKNAIPAKIGEKTPLQQVVSSERYNYFQGHIVEFNPQLPDMKYINSKDYRDNDIKEDAKNSLFNPIIFKPAQKEGTLKLYEVGDLQLCLRCQDDDWYKELKRIIPPANEGFHNAISVIYNVHSFELPWEADKKDLNVRVEGQKVAFPVKCVTETVYKFIRNHMRYETDNTKGKRKLCKLPYFSLNEFSEEKLYFKWGNWGNYYERSQKTVGVYRRNVYNIGWEKIFLKDIDHHTKVYYFDRVFFPNTFNSIIGMCVTFMYGLTDTEGNRDPEGLCGFKGWFPGDPVEVEVDEDAYFSEMAKERWTIKEANIHIDDKQAEWRYYGPPGACIRSVGRAMMPIKFRETETDYIIGGIEYTYGKLFTGLGKYMVERAICDIFYHYWKFVNPKTGGRGKKIPRGDKYPVVFLYNAAGTHGYDVYFEAGFRRILDLRLDVNYLENMKYKAYRNRGSHAQTQVANCDISSNGNWEYMKDSRNKLKWRKEGEDGYEDFWNRMIMVDNETKRPLDKNKKVNNELCNGLMILYKDGLDVHRAVEYYALFLIDKSRSEKELKIRNFNNFQNPVDKKDNLYSFFVSQYSFDEYVKKQIITPHVEKYTPNYKLTYTGPDPKDYDVWGKYLKMETRPAKAARIDAESKAKEARDNNTVDAKTRENQGPATQSIRLPTRSRSRKR